MLTRLTLLLLVAAAGGYAADDEIPQLRFEDSGFTVHGEWRASAGVSPGRWRPRQTVTVNATLGVAASHLESLLNAGIKADGFCLLVTAERTFDAGGVLRLASDERMSTLLTPTGIAIEGGVQGAVTDRFGYYRFSTPYDEFSTHIMPAGEEADGRKVVRFSVVGNLPPELPPGIYRVRLDFGVTVGTRYYNLNGEAFARRPFFQGRPTESHLYSPPFPASGLDASGKAVDASAIRPRIPWVLLNGYNSNGYRGVVALEDQANFALSSRNLIQDDVILPRYNDARQPLTYNLEPQFPTDTIELRSNIPWDFTKGELSIQVTGPDGKTVDLGKAPFAGNTGQWPTTRRREFTAWRPPDYGQYTVKATGWTADIWGNRYEGGGTYRFWIAKRMTLATATFQGMAYPVGNRYGRDIGFAPAVPAEVEVTASLFAHSDPRQVRRIRFSGKATDAGLFTAAQGNTPLPFDAPGEYIAHVLAKYWDKDGHLWVCSMRHAGVVYPENSPIVARGKKLRLDGKFVDRGETHFEGYTDHLAHINFPYNQGDVLLIASEQEGANKIEPVLNWEWRDNPQPYESRLTGVGTSNLQLETSNGYSPHLFPEYITSWAYYYGAGPRPGFMSRFLVGEDGVRAPYWPTSRTNFGGQINASSNGDMPGDIYRLIGGVVLRRQGEAPLYAGYLASAFILPKGTNNNRVIAPGSEDLPGSDGRKARFHLVGTRPGMLYEVGTAFAPAVQIDPVLPVNLTAVLTYPDGRQKVAQGTGDKFGSWANAERWTLDEPGMYRFHLEAEWQGYRGRMPGLPASGGAIYVVEKDRPAVSGFSLDLPDESSFAPQTGLTITGRSTASEVHYAAVIPGAVIAQGAIEVKDGRFRLFFDPAAIEAATPTYDTRNLLTKAPDIKDVVHLTFFSKEKKADGSAYHNFTRLILRGNRVLYTK